MRSTGFRGWCPVAVALITAGTVREAPAQAPAISILDASASEGNGGVNQIGFTVFLSSRPSQTVSFQISTSDQTATSAGQCGGAADYAASGLQGMSFTSRDSLKTFLVTTCGDNRDEDNETFRVFIQSPNNATIADGEAIGTLVDDDDGPRLSIANASAAEGNAAGTRAFAVSMSATSGREVRVAFAVTASGTRPATVGANCGGNVDVQSAPGTLVIPAGQNGGTVNVPICGDAVPENNETFRVTLSAPVNATIQTGTATGTLLNDDPPNVTINNVTRAEGDPRIPGGGTIIPPDMLNLSVPSPTPMAFTISLSNPTTLPVTVTWETRNGTGGGGAECRQTLSGGVNPPPQFKVPIRDFLSRTGQTATIAPGGLTATAAVTSCLDFGNEANETFSVFLLTATNANITDNTGTGTLTDDD
jgi:chitinase